MLRSLPFPSDARQRRSPLALIGWGGGSFLEKLQFPAELH